MDLVPPPYLFLYRMTIDQIASAIYNDVFSGLRGANSNILLSMEQLEDEVLEERQTVIKEMYYKGLLNVKDLQMAINCIEIDCKDPAKCCNKSLGHPTQHFEIPQLVNDLGDKAITYIGSADREFEFTVYTSTSYKYHQYRKRKTNTPYVYVETTPNENGMYDCWLFNAPFVKTIAVIGIFKDPRQLEKYSCCNQIEAFDLGGISNEVKKRLTEKKLRYYRQFQAPILPNDQTPR